MPVRYAKTTVFSNRQPADYDSLPLSLNVPLTPSSPYESSPLRETTALVTGIDDGAGHGRGFSLGSAGRYPTGEGSYAEGTGNPTQSATPKRITAFIKGIDLNERP